jgi:hypothetical protein
MKRKNITRHAGKVKRDGKWVAHETLKEEYPPTMTPPNPPVEDKLDFMGEFTESSAKAILEQIQKIYPHLISQTHHDLIERVRERIEKLRDKAKPIVLGDEVYVHPMRDRIFRDVLKILEEHKPCPPPSFQVSKCCRAKVSCVGDYNEYACYKCGEMCDVVETPPSFQDQLSEIVKDCLITGESERVDKTTPKPQYGDHKYWVKQITSLIRKMVVRCREESGVDEMAGCIQTLDRYQQAIEKELGGQDEL